MIRLADFSSLLTVPKLALALFIALALPSAWAGVPNKDAVPAYPEEQTIMQAEANTADTTAASTASGKEHMDRHYLGKYGEKEHTVLLQRGGNTWRVLRNGPMATIAGALLLVVPLLIFLFHSTIGPAHKVAPSGRRIQRFSNWQRTVHWSTAVSFLFLSVSGVIIMFGKVIMLPWMGHDLFAWVAIIAKYLHNFVGPMFILCSILLFITFVRKNFFNRLDKAWLKSAGGLFSKKHVPAAYFNAGEKIWFWGGVVLLGLVMSVTGLLLDFINLGQSRYVLQIADILHIVGATLYIVGTMGHSYIGTAGTPGAYEAMRSGTVDEAWAQAHHEVWYDEVKLGAGVDGARNPSVAPGAQPRPHH